MVVELKQGYRWYLYALCSHFFFIGYRKSWETSEWEQILRNSFLTQSRPLHSNALGDLVCRSEEQTVLLCEWSCV